MTITIGTLSFDNVEYDADVLYLSVGEPCMTADFAGLGRDNHRGSVVGAAARANTIAMSEKPAPRPALTGPNQAMIKPDPGAILGGRGSAKQ